ncbi:hypothetical protein ABZV29_08890 [Streptomyces sp. NPDC005236]|uniref:hypothetical protein n=1 Tax=Streptomyces sp. NPDC005236 TaxID=3157028 RepID=UPI0033ABD463
MVEPAAGTDPASTTACTVSVDAPNGIRSAAAAGMPVLAIPRDRMELRADIAHLPLAHAPDAAHAPPLLTRLLAHRLEPAIPGRPPGTAG